jgi:hypothetical protein
MLGSYRAVDPEAVAALPEEQAVIVSAVRADSSQIALRYVAILPAIMFLCYLALIGYFRGKGGYEPVHLEAEVATGGVEGPVV